MKTIFITWQDFVQAYLVIHNDHVSTEEVVVCNDAGEPLGGRVLSVHTHAVAIQGVGSWWRQTKEEDHSTVAIAPLRLGSRRSVPRATLRNTIEQNVIIACTVRRECEPHLQ